METRDPGNEYVEQMRAEGYTDLDIRDALKDAGWSDDEIRRAMAPAEECPPPPPPREPRRERRPQRSGGGDSTAVWLIVLVGCLGMIVAVGAVLAAILFPVFLRSREKAVQSSCLSNLKQIGLAQLMYAQDYGETMALAPAWPDRLYPYINNAQVLQCPSAEGTSSPTWSGGRVDYTMNSDVSGMQLKNIGLPANVPIDYDGTAVVGGRGTVAFRHNDGANCGYVDGHVKWVHSGAWNSNWTAPTAGSPGGQPVPQTPPSPPAPQPAPAQPDTTSQAPAMSPQEKARASACQSNLKQLSLAMLMYASDWDGMAPAAQEWPEALYPYVSNQQLYICPSDAQPHRSANQGWDVSYTMNDTLSRLRVRERARTARGIMLFDGSVLGGGADAAEFRHAGGLNTSYLDGHVSRVEGADWQATWDQQPSE